MKEITIQDLQQLDPLDPNAVVCVLIPKGTPMKASHRFYESGKLANNSEFLDCLDKLICERLDCTPNEERSVNFMKRVSAWGTHIPSVQEVSSLEESVVTTPCGSSSLVLEGILNYWTLTEHHPEHRYFVFDNNDQAKAVMGLLNQHTRQLVKGVPETAFAPRVDPLLYNVAVRSYVIVYITIPVLDETVWIYQYHSTKALDLIHALTDKYGSVDNYFKWLTDNWMLPKDCTIKHWSIDDVVVSHKSVMCKS